VPRVRDFGRALGRSRPRDARPATLPRLSFITLTSVGYGDIVPLGEFARSLAILEAITGVMFQAIFMARLVGLYAPGAGKAT